MIRLCLIAILFAGCSTPPADSDFRPLAAATIATSPVGGVAPAPMPTPSGKCANCNGTGKLGDGTVGVPCPVCKGKGVTATIEDEPIPVVMTPEPPKPATLRAYVVTACKTPGCKDHGAFARELQRLSNWGDKLRVLAANNPADAEQIKNLNIPCDAFSYVVLTDGFNVYVKPWPKNADEIGNWLLETAKDKRPDCVWGVAGDVEPQPNPSVDHIASARKVATPTQSGLYSLALVTDPEHCPPCAALERDRASIEQELGAEFRIVAPGSQEFPCRSIPTVFLLLDGKPVAQTSGYRGKRHFLSWLAKAEREHGGRWR
jgi:hypothetical protein